MELEKPKNIPVSFNLLFLTQTRVFDVSHSLKDCNILLKRLHEDNFLKSLFMNVNRMEFQAETSKNTQFLMKRRQGRNTYQIEGQLNKIDEETTEVRMQSRVPVWFYLIAMIAMAMLFFIFPENINTPPLQFFILFAIVSFFVGIAFHYYIHKNMLKTVEETLA
jgi:lipopolysaccharide export LptBFGC system permease protein LptF